MHFLFFFVGYLILVLPNSEETTFDRENQLEEKTLEINPQEENPFFMEFARTENVKAQGPAEVNSEQSRMMDAAESNFGKASCIL